MTTHTATELQEIKSRFDIDGFINFGRILETSEARVLGELIDGMCAGTVEVPEKCLRFFPRWDERGSNRVDAVWQVLDAHRHDESLRAICEKPLIREVIELLMEGPAQLDTSQVIMKPAYHGNVVPWHQDSSYWGREQRMTCWLAIDDATPFNGCMRMIPGSHRQGQADFTTKPFDSVGIDLLETNDIDEDTQLCVPVNAGCASFHHPMTLHASDANTTPNRRRAIAITYLKLAQ